MHSNAAETHTERLVHTESEDGYLLDGALLAPAQAGGRPKLPLVWMHGFTGYFYEQHTLTIGRRLAERGHVFVAGNSRGHNLGANLVNLRGGEDLWAGALWELFDACLFDYSAWVGFAIALGFPSVVLAGHSLGAIKAVYYQGTRQDERVAALIAASGPVRIGERMRQLAEHVELAEHMLAAGRGAELLPPDPRGRITSAQTLVSRARTNMDVYGLEREDAPLGRIRCPILFVLGSAEPEIGTAADLPLLRQKACSASSVGTLYVEGADHVYHERAVAVADGIGDWLDQLA